MVKGDIIYDIECPYCEHEQDVCNDDGFGMEENIPHEYQCRKCEKYFIFYTTISWYYDSQQADCLNGGEHKLKKINGYPKEEYKNKYYCEDCGKKIEKENNV